MAASGSNLVRVRLYFDYPPPCMPHCRMSWVLLDLNRCRVVADLCSVIKERFNYSRRAELDLFLQECYLPPAESIHVVRDDDAIRVKVFSHEMRKRRREEEDDGTCQGSKKKSKRGETQVNGLVDETQKQKKKRKKRRRRREEKQDEEGLKPANKSGKCASPFVCANGKLCGASAAREASSEESSSSEGEAEKVNNPEKKPTKPGAPSAPPKPTTNSKTGKKPPKEFSSDSSSSSEDEDNEAPAVKGSTLSIRPASILPKSTTSSKKKPGTPLDSSSSSSSDEGSRNVVAVKPSPKSTPSSQAGTAPQTLCNPKNPSVHQAPPSSGSSYFDKGDATATVNPPKTQTRDPSDSTPSTPPPDSDSDTDIKLVIKKPNFQFTPGLTPRGKGRGYADRAKNRGGPRGGFGRARGTPWKRQGFHFNYDNDEKRDTQSNQSLVIQNPPEPVPPRDYAALPLLAAPPSVGSKIAFKLLELTENYTPEVSQYKEGKVVGFNPSTNMMELELLSQMHARAEPGKFDLVYQNPDGSESVEYAVTLGSQLTERWESLLEPRLLVESTA